MIDDNENDNNLLHISYHVGFYNILMYVCLKDDESISILFYLNGSSSVPQLISFLFIVMVLILNGGDRAAGLRINIDCRWVQLMQKQI